ncbi:Inner membrane protein YbhQ [Klebsiella pneumoniae IS46]|uniref:Inner membrane protein YbhQ n=1 Tax=Klebsiella pneumoniae IS43 TaxID=1432552 RepID=W1DUC6_KLEPN|nr:Inner membrane protein YbhQ [Klebsiella pneumoniae IS43]CDL17025.1 Inner membrane protein YbhQ [Klebsiella pneumoniae IS46]CDL44761.1 Inner membrane protein YbhQ [Klebsiella pneumoniae ISC21]
MSKSHPRWRMAKRVLTVLFFIAVIVLLVIYAQKSRLAGRVEGDPRLRSAGLV